jgi:hypothetical protein
VNTRIYRLGLFVLGLLVCTCVAETTPPSEILQGEAVSIPFAEAGKIVFVPVKVRDSRPLAFILDTGSTRMLIDQSVSRELGLNEAEPDSVGGAGAGRISIKKIRDISIEIGGRRSQHYEFASIDLSAISSLLGRQVDGILGYEFLSRYLVTIDYDRSMLVLRSPESAPAIQGVPIPITLEKRWPFLEARLVVRGAAPLVDKFLIDSGSSDDVDHPIVAQPEVQKQATTTGRGLGQPVPGFIGRAEELEFGPFKLRDLTIASGGGTEAASKLIGSGVLSRFNITYDYPHSRIFVADRGEPSK